MQVALADVTAKMTAVLTAKGYKDQDIPFMINMYLGGEMRGHTSHGLASFVSFAQSDPEITPEPIVLKDTHAMLAVDARGGSGNVIGRWLADEAIRRAQAEGVGTALVKNMDSWLRPGGIAEYIAEHGMVSIIINCGGGAMVAPPGGFQGVAGTNPIAYGMPTPKGPFVVDIATSKHAWGVVRMANKFGTELPADAFYNKNGDLTTDPAQATSIKPFGEYKGFALALMVEILCGSLIGMDMMRDSSKGHQFGQKTLLRGAIVIVIDSNQTGSKADFMAATADYLQKIRDTRALPGQSVRIPGDVALDRVAKVLESGHMEIPDSLWKEIQAL